MARKPEQHLVKPKAALFAVICGCLLFAAVFVAVELVLPQQDAKTSNRNYGYEYSGAKSSSVAFNTANDADDSVLVFGSSELSTPSSTVPEVPSVIFGNNNYGIDLTYIGEAFDQSLWHAIAAGAYADSTSNKKVVLIVSPGWFTDGGVDNETFKLRFSYSLYRAFCDNDKISDASKSYLKKRLKEQGIDDMTIEAGMRDLPQDYLNDAVLSTMDDLKLRGELSEVREGGLDQSERGTEQYSFSEVEEGAVQHAKERSTNNDWGMDDEYYSENLEGKLDSLKDHHADETYTDTPEYNDLNFFLKVCREVGLEPLVVISPVHGKFYDLEGIDKETRATCYSRIRHICKKHGVQYADFSDREYEKYFLHDTVHFGGPGWVAVEEAIYDYVKQ